LALIHFLGIRTYTVELRRDLEELEKNFNDLVRRVAPLFSNEPSNSFTSTTNNTVTLPADNFADPTNPVILTHTPGVLRSVMRSDAAPKLSQEIAPTWTASHTWTPTANSTPLTVNATSALSSANMQAWSPLTGYDTIVTKDGNVGVGDESPTANLSVRARATDPYSTIIGLSPWAWWDASDIDGDRTYNANHSAGVSLFTNWYDKSGNTHTLPPASSTNTLSKGTGASGKDEVNVTGGFLAWTGSAWDDPSTWTAFIVYRTGTPFASADCWFLLGGSGNDRVLSLPNDGSYYAVKTCLYYNNDAPPHTSVSKLTTSGGSTPTAWDTNWHAFSWEWTGAAHKGYMQGLLLDADTNPAHNETAGNPALSTWKRLFIKTGGTLTVGVRVCEILLFQPGLNPTNRAIVDAYLAAKYSGAPAVSAQALEHWKDASGNINSTVDVSLNWGLGTAATPPAAKLHIIKTTEQLRLGYSASAYTGFLAPVGSGTITYTLPTASAAGILHNSAGSVWSWSAVALGSADVSGTLPILNGGTGATTLAGAGIVVGSGTLNTLAKWTGTGASLGNSNITDDGFNITTTAGTDPSGTGGLISIYGGNAQATGLVSFNGGGILYIAGTGYRTGTGGGCRLDAGQGGATGKGGSLGLTGGPGGVTSGAGGDVRVTAGNATGGNSNGGNTYLAGGLKTGSGTPGSVFISNPTTGFSAILNVNGLISSDQTYTFPSIDGDIVTGSGTTGTVPVWSSTTPPQLENGSFLFQQSHQLLIGGSGSGSFNPAIISVRDGSYAVVPGSILLNAGNALAGVTDGASISLTTGAGFGGGKHGIVKINTFNYEASLSTENLLSNRDFLFPDQAGTLALTSDFAGFTTYTGGALTNNLVLLGAGGGDIKTLATASSGLFLRDDSTWAAPAGSGTVTGTGTTGRMTKWTNGAGGILGDTEIAQGSTGGFVATLDTSGLSAGHIFTFPDQAGTFAMTSDLDSGPWVDSDPTVEYQPPTSLTGGGGLRVFSASTGAAGPIPYFEFTQDYSTGVVTANATYGTTPKFAFSDEVSTPQITTPIVGTSAAAGSTGITIGPAVARTGTAKQVNFVNGGNSQAWFNTAGNLVFKDGGGIFSSYGLDETTYTNMGSLFKKMWTGTMTGQTYAFYIMNKAVPTAASPSSDTYGLQLESTFESSTASASLAAINGASFSASDYGSAASQAIDSVIGGQFSARLAGTDAARSGNTIGQLQAGTFSIALSGTNTTVSIAEGIRFYNPGALGSGSSLANLFGAHFEQPTRGTNNYGIFLEATGTTYKAIAIRDANAGIGSSAAGRIDIMATEFLVNSTNLGFYNATPVAKSTGWAASNVSSDKVFDANSTSIDELADVLGTLINDLKSVGLLGA